MSSAQAKCTQSRVARNWAMCLVWVKHWTPHTSNISSTKGLHCQSHHSQPSSHFWKVKVLHCMQLFNHIATMYQHPPGLHSLYQVNIAVMPKGSISINYLRWSHPSLEKDKTCCGGELRSSQKSFKKNDRAKPFDFFSNGLQESNWIDFI